MENSTNCLKIILNDYEDDDVILQKIEKHITIDLPLLISNWKIREKELFEIDILINDYVNNFFSNENKQYFYVNEKMPFYVKYDGINYEFIKEDDIWHNTILDIVEKYEILSEKKREIAGTIIERIKKNELFYTIPESITIQNMIQFFHPMFFKTKEDTKHFFATIGDCLLEKSGNLIYYTSESSRNFINEIESYYKDYFHKSLYNNQYKFKYRGADYINSRIITFNKIILNKQIWSGFLKNNIFNLLVVCAHYSNRYVCSDIYISKQSMDFQNKINYLKNRTKDNIIDEFINKMLISKEGETITCKNMYFLWKLFCDMNNIPLIIYRNDFNELMKKKIKHEDDTIYVYTNVCSDYLQPAKNFGKFWENQIDMNENIDEEYELSEITELYNIWLKDEMKKKYKMIKEYQLKNLILYYYPKMKMNGKYIYNIRCKLWDKKKDIRNCLLHNFDKSIKMDMTVLEAYKSYCAYGDKKDYINIVSKRYFEKYIGKIIPKQYMKNNYIMMDYWLNTLNQ